MQSKNSFALLATIILVAFCIVPVGISQSYSHSYQLLNKPEGTIHYRLYVEVQQSLYQYYQGKSHQLISSADFPKFVTPYAVKPIADRLWEIYNDDENFANGVLMIVHQIPYVEKQAKYPVETIVENEGDCDLFSYLAASIMKAGGMDVVLLYYETKRHMNVGVNLSHPPRDARSPAYYVTLGQTRYYIAEVTGGDWEDGWRVGECPEDLRAAPVEIVTLENCEQTTYGQVSASYKMLAASTISLMLSQSFALQGSQLILSGKLSPSLQNETITIYISVNSSPWTILGSTTTNSDGEFAITWNANAMGICYIRASWSGNEDYAGADSTIQTVTVLSVFFIMILAFTIILVCAGLIIFILSRRGPQEIQEPQPPEAP